MGYTINTKPTMNLQGGSSQPPVQTSSTNASYGIPDVPEAAKTKQMTRSDVQEALKKGEIVYGLLPEYPTFEAIDGIKFDYCDGLRIYVPPVENGTQPKKYFLQIQEEKMGVILHNQSVESGAYISTLQKFYTEFSLTLVRQDYLPDNIRDQMKDRHKADDSTLNAIIEMCWAPGIKSDAVIQEMERRQVSCDDMPWLVDKILDYIQTNQTFIHKFDPKDKEVMVQLPAGTIGDSVGWFAYMERFQKKTGCKLVCVMNPFISALFEKQYPDITFITPKQTLDHKPYAAYKMGLFFKGNTTDQPYDFRYIGNHRTASKILDVNDDDIPPRVDLSAPRKIKEPYVCIAVQASAYCKLWNNSVGWQEVVKHLREIGYKIYCIDKDTVTGQGIATNHIPWGVEDDTGNKPLQERIDMLKDCDFFIGLSSGVSWLAWCAKCPVVMISGFTNPFNEFYTPYRVINTLFCHGCWNDERCDFDHYDYMWCPRHKGTEKAYECSRVISPKHVINVIKTIPEYRQRVMEHSFEECAEKTNEFIRKFNYDCGEVSPSVIEDIVTPNRVAPVLPDPVMTYVTSTYRRPTDE